MEMVVPILALVILGVFVAGFVVAARTFEDGFAKFFMGLLFGLGFLLAIVGILFAGCLLAVSRHPF